MTKVNQFNGIFPYFFCYFAFYMYFLFDFRSKTITFFRRSSLLKAIRSNILVFFSDVFVGREMKWKETVPHENAYFFCIFASFCLLYDWRVRQKPIWKIILPEIYIYNMFFIRFFRINLPLVKKEAAKAYLKSHGSLLTPKMIYCTIRFIYFILNVTSRFYFSILYIESFWWFHWINLMYLK